MQLGQPNRRAFISLLGGAAAAWPLAARAQQGKQRRIGVLMHLAADDPESSTRIAALRQGLHHLGWADGGNVLIEYRWAKGQAELFRQGAKELVQLAPDVLVASTSLAVPALQEASRTLPIVFINVVDPVGAGFAASLAAPGGNATGFALFEFGISAKWLELLKEIAPSVTRIAILRDASLTGVGQLGAIQAVGSSFGVELTTIGIDDLNQMELALTKFARSPNVGLIVTLSQPAAVHRALIIGLAAKLGLPAIYALPLFAKSGGLIAYGPNVVDPYRRAAEYIDRILKGEKPADLPVQAPTKYEMVINLKTAKALALTIPPMLLARADEVIE
jgi:putative tryptophan/tyrosine transport system substrate-binding protein